MNIDELVSTGTNYPPFLKQSELKKGTIVTVTSELREPNNPKIKSKYLMDVDYNGTVYTWTPNETSLRGIAKLYSNVTANWIGKQIEFLGMKPMGAGRGYLWAAYEKV